MIRSSARKTALLAVATLAVGATAVNCTQKRGGPQTLPDETGSISLQLTLPSGAEVTMVDFEVIAPDGTTAKSGKIDVSGKNAMASVLLTGLAPSEPSDPDKEYLAKMSATTTDGKTKCAGQSFFDVFVDITTSVSILLQCTKEGDTGNAVLRGAFNTCPVIDSYSVSPLSTDVGKTMDLKAAAHDLDCVTLMGTMCTQFEAVTLGWTASAGTIAPPGAAMATYTCTAPGVHKLTLTVSDATCPVTREVEVTCVSDSCGNNIKEPTLGEECDGTDTPAGQTCNANCRIVPNCGNNIVESGEGCDPPNMGPPPAANTCDAACQGVAIVCGNNIIQMGEQCDPPVTNQCTATCQNFMATCGDGVVNQASEECDLGAQNGQAGSGCSSTCTIVLSPCEQCEKDAQTHADSNIRSACDPTKSGCTLLTGMDKTLCLDLVDCMRMTGCPVNATGDSQICYCGTASDIGCLGGSANGVCKAKVEAAAKSTDPEVIANGFTDPSLPLGRAANLMVCDSKACMTACTF